MLVKNKLNTTIVLALLLRLLLIPLFYHPDIKSQYFHFQFLSQNQLNIYKYISENKDNLPYKDTFNYLPLTYYTFGSIYIFLKPFLPVDFNLWLNDWSEYQNNYPNLFYFLLILKIPYVIFDFIIAYLILEITKKNILFHLWLFNPFSFYLIYILGNFDIFPLTLTLTSFYLLKKRPKLALILFGCAIAMKLYPLIFLPFYLLYISKRPMILFINLLLSLFPLLLTASPFLFSHIFWSSFLGSGLTQKIIEVKIYNIPVFPILYIILFIKYYLSDLNNLPKYIFYIFLIFISSVNFHPQWLLWFFPFIFIIKKPTIFFVIILTLILFFGLLWVFLINDNFLFWGHLIPVDLAFLQNTSPYNLIRYRFLHDPQIFQNQIKIIITILASILFIKYEKINRHSNN